MYYLDCYGVFQRDMSYVMGKHVMRQA